MKRDITPLAKDILLIIVWFFAIAILIYQLWLASGIMDAWASKENLENLPSLSDKIAIVAIIQCLLTLLILLPQFFKRRKKLSESKGVGSKNSSMSKNEKK